MSERKKNILIIEDNEAFSKGLSQVLRKYAYEPYILDNIDEAVQVLETLVPDAVITDIILPDNYGYEIIHYIKANFIDLPVIAISGGGRRLNSKYYLQFAETIGADHILHKPFEVRDLIKVIEQYQPDEIQRNKKNTL